MSIDERVIEAASRFAEHHVASRADAWDAGEDAAAATLRLAAAQFAGLRVPATLGGQGASVLTACGVFEQFARHDIGFALALAVHCNVTLAASAVPDAVLRDRYLPSLLSGRAIGAFCMTEPHAGSDIAAMRTSAVARAGRLFVNGHKAWITNCGSADVLALYARTDAGAGLDGIALFLTGCGRAGLERRFSYRLSGGLAADVGELVFEDFPIDDDELALAAGQAMRSTLRTLDAARVGVAAMCNGALAAALDASAAHARERPMFGATTFSMQGIQWAFADALTLLEASRALTARAAAALDSGQPAPALAAHAKKFANQAAFDGLSWAMRAMGARGTDRRHLAARHFAASQLLFNTDGTPEVLNRLISRSLASA